MAGPPARQPDLEHLEGFQQVQNGAVIDRDRLAGRVLPLCPGGSSFEGREPIRVEQFPLVGLIFGHNFFQT